jgi:hypothetical protein
MLARDYRLSLEAENKTLIMIAATGAPSRAEKKNESADIEARATPM